MAIEFQCPRCDRRHVFKAKKGSRRMSVCKCGYEFLVPESGGRRRSQKLTFVVGVLIIILLIAAVFGGTYWYMFLR